MDKLDIHFANEHEIRSVQLKALDILEHFMDFCNKHALSCFVIGGALIGAAREGGFIAWDDDIDVFMPRGDYEKLLELWPRDGLGQYMLCRSNEEINYRHTDTSIVDTATTFINTHSKDLNIAHGICIDIIPLDGCAPGGIKRAMQIFWAMAFCLFNAQRLPDNQGRLAKVLAKAAYAIVQKPKTRYKIWSMAEKRMSQYPISESAYVAELVTGMKYLKLRYPKEIFASSVQLGFEGTQISAPAGYRQYLSMAFGDYMSPPPESERKPKHHTEYYSATQPYAEFKGIFYALAK
jgi:lipopolysaccharide cholinephosphotransferase